MLTASAFLQIKASDNHHLRHTTMKETKRLPAVRASWQIETRHLACCWSEIGQRIRYNPRRLKEISEVQGGYLRPVPEIASHDQLGEATWFLPHTTDCDSE